MCTYMWVTTEVTEDIGFPEALVTGGYELPARGAGN